MQELRDALGDAKQGTSSGSDGLTYEALRAYAHSDHASKLLALLNRYLLGQEAFPANWHVGEICLLIAEDTAAERAGGPAPHCPDSLFVQTVFTHAFAQAGG